jgi:hypothetical protein
MKTWVWLSALFTVLLLVLVMMRSRETFSGPCQYSDMKANTSLSGCSLGCKTFPTLEEAQTACSAEPTCGGITQRGGQMIFELRAGPETKPSTAGESSWVCSTPVPPPPVASPPPVTATPMAGTPEPVSPPTAPATIVLPFNTGAGTYLLRPMR